MFTSLRIWQKLTLLVLLMGLPVTVLLHAYLSSRNELLVFTDQEQEGAAYFKPLNRVLLGVEQHRAAAHAWLSGGAQFQAHVKEVEAQLDRDIQEVDKADAASGGPLGTTKAWGDWKSRWQELRSQVGQSTAASSFEKHTALVAGLAELIVQVGDRSNLILDPEADTYYLASTLFDRYFRAVETKSLADAYVLGLTVRGQASAEETAQADRLVRQSQSSFADLSRQITSAVKYNGELGPGVTTFLTPLATASAKQSETLRKAIADKAAAAQWKSATDSLGQFSEFAEGIRSQLTSRLGGRESRIRKEKYGQLGLAALALVLAAFGAYQISSRINLQISGISRMFTRIDAGDFKARCVAVTGDELGSMAQSLNSVMDKTLVLIQSSDERDQIQNSIKRLLEEVSGVAEGDLSKEAEVTADITGAIADSFNYMITELRQVIAQVQTTAKQVSSSSSNVQNAAEFLAQGSDRQARDIVSASKSIEQMATSIQQVTSVAGSAAEVARTSLNNAQQGAEAVNKTIQGMSSIRLHVQETSKRIKRLGESSQEISEIVELIRDIADRTSVLALNASIQAAMAGEAGKGFAVVAEEVERLAQRAAESTRRITSLIESVQSDTGEAVASMEATTLQVVQGSRLANEAGQKLQQIQSVSKEISELVRSISSDSTAQARHSVDVSQQVVSISRISQDTAEGTRRAAASVRRLAELVEELNLSVSRFKLPKEQTATAAG
ncbi:MAG: methyl-accepting chemotaxis protein [Bryobacteraceae bacterium]